MPLFPFYYRKKQRYVVQAGWQGAQHLLWWRQTVLPPLFYSNNYGKSCILRRISPPNWKWIHWEFSFEIKSIPGVWDIVQLMECLLSIHPRFWFHPQLCIDGAWWHMPVIPALGSRQSSTTCEVQGHLWLHEALSQKSREGEEDKNVSHYSVNRNMVVEAFWMVECQMGLSLRRQLSSWAFISRHIVLHWANFAHFLK